MSREAVVLLSGGLDSTTVGAMARASGLGLRTLTIDYGQRHTHELEAAAGIACWLGSLEHRVVRIDLGGIGDSALTGERSVPAHGETPEGEIPTTYVPARNTLFLALAGGFAEARGAGEVHVGVNAVDFSGYPDCRPAFIHAMERALAEGTRCGLEGRPIRLVTPLIDLDKAAIIRAGIALGVDYRHTHSCYDPAPEGLACGRCDACHLRRRGFEAAGIPDPTRYADG